MVLATTQIIPPQGLIQAPGLSFLHLTPSQVFYPLLGITHSCVPSGLRGARHASQPSRLQIRVLPSSRSRETLSECAAPRGFHGDTEPAHCPRVNVGPKRGRHAIRVAFSLTRHAGSNPILDDSVISPWSENWTLTKILPFKVVVGYVCLPSLGFPLGTKAPDGPSRGGTFGPNTETGARQRSLIAHSGSGSRQTGFMRRASISPFGA